jgi:hypothetical protein
VPLRVLAWFSFLFLMIALWPAGYFELLTLTRKNQ